MKVILVSIGVFQSYIIDCIKNLLIHNNKDITVITESYYFNFFKDYPEIELINKDDLKSDLINDYLMKSSLDRYYRNGFWINTSLRMFYIHAYLKKYNKEKIIHLENDNMIYEDLELLKDFLKKDKIYCTFDCPTRVILGIIYIPNDEELKKVLDNYNYKIDDMYNFGLIKINENLPIINDNYDYNNKKPIIFDAAAMGQYLGGIDPMNNPNDTRGFINETCIIDYSKYKFYWKKNQNNLWCPYLNNNGELIKIINLHIHSKKLEKFSSLNPKEFKFIELMKDN